MPKYHAGSNSSSNREQENVSTALIGASDSGLEQAEGDEGATDEWGATVDGSTEKDEGVEGHPGVDVDAGVEGHPGVDVDAGGEGHPGVDVDAGGNGNGGDDARLHASPDSQSSAPVSVQPSIGSRSRQIISPRGWSPYRAVGASLDTLPSHAGAGAGAVHTGLASTVGSGRESGGGCGDISNARQSADRTSTRDTSRRVGLVKSGAIKNHPGSFREVASNLAGRDNLSPAPVPLATMETNVQHQHAMHPHQRPTCDRLPSWAWLPAWGGGLQLVRLPDAVVDVLAVQAGIRIGAPRNGSAIGAGPAPSVQSPVVSVLCVDSLGHGSPQRYGDHGGMQRQTTGSLSVPEPSLEHRQSQSGQVEEVAGTGSQRNTQIQNRNKEREEEEVELPRPRPRSILLNGRKRRRARIRPTLVTRIVSPTADPEDVAAHAAAGAIRARERQMAALSKESGEAAPRDRVRNAVKRARTLQAAGPFARPSAVGGIGSESGSGCEESSGGGEAVEVDSRGETVDGEGDGEAEGEGEKQEQEQVSGNRASRMASDDDEENKEEEDEDEGEFDDDVQEEEEEAQSTYLRAGVDAQEDEDEDGS